MIPGDENADDLPPDPIDLHEIPEEPAHSDGVQQPLKEMSEEEISRKREERRLKKLMHNSQKLGKMDTVTREHIEGLLKKLSSYNFTCHGKKLQFAEKALNYFTPKMEFRKKIVWLIEWVWFDRFLTFIILSNAIMLATTDYSYRV